MNLIKFKKEVEKLKDSYDAICYLVEIISKKSGNYKWKTTVNKHSVSCERIRRVSIDCFLYEVTGDNDAFHKICKQLPVLIQEVVEELKYNGNFSEDTVFCELEQIDSNISDALFKLAFEGYIGF